MQVYGLRRVSTARLLPTRAPALALTLALSTVLGGCAGGSPVAKAPDASPPEQPAPSSQPAVPLTVLPHPALSQVGSASNIADVAEHVTPSVVNISATKLGRKVDYEGTPFGDPFFKRFFPEGEPPRRHNQYGLGSGVIVSDPATPGQKFVLTNHHVIADADRILVRTASGERVKARLLGSDPQSDLAVLRLEGDTSALQALNFGDSARLRLGDIVLAVGNPFGVGQTVTMGIVSAKGRSNMGIVDYEDFIQTDAAINPGNSGGALIDMEGNLVGINTAILGNGGSVGIGFAIPSAMASKIMHSLIEYGEVRRGWLGVVIQDLDAELGQALGVSATHGVVVSDMEKSGPGARAGLTQGDVILSVNGTPVESTGELRNAIAAAGSGSSVKLGVLRGKQQLSVDVTLGEAKTKGPREKSPRAAPSSSWGGVKVDELTPELRSRLHLPDSVPGGVIVKSVEGGSTAELSGIQRGDIVTSVDKRAVKSVADFEQALAKHKSGTKALLLVYRGGRAMYMLLEVGRK
ncbi:MAG: Do family serine endopeptidase [Polyangiaceae bacterium]